MYVRTVSFEEYINLPRPSVDWLVEDYIPHPGKVMLIGPPKAGKSFLAMDIAFRVSRGEDVFGKRARQTKVLYLNLDMDESEMRERGHDLVKAGYSVSTDDLRMVHPDDDIRPLDVTQVGGYAWLKKAVEVDDPGLVVVDVLREIHTAEENDSTEMKRVFDSLERALRGRSVLYVHHTKKFPPDMETDPDPNNASRGSSYLTGKVHAFWLLYNNKLTITSRSRQGQSIPCRRSTTGMWEFPDILDSAATKRALDLCAEFPAEKHNKLAEEAAKRWGMSRSAYYRALSGSACVHRQSGAAPDPVPAEPASEAPHPSPPQPLLESPPTVPPSPRRKSEAAAVA